jgi:uncharacterized protein YdhG (YjbR/CyaY superfamily)
MRSSASTVAEYMESLPAERRKEMAAVRRAVRRHLPKGYEEAMNWGMVTWQVPLRRHPHTYNKQPLCYAALASQKQYCALYLMGCYAVPGQLARLRAAFEASGTKMDMGKSCLRFTRAADLPLDVIGDIIGAFSPEAWVELAERARSAHRSTRQAAKATRSTKDTPSTRTAKAARTRRPRRPRDA